MCIICIYSIYVCSIYICKRQMTPKILSHLPFFYIYFLFLTLIPPETSPSLSHFQENERKFFNISVEMPCANVQVVDMTKWLNCFINWFFSKKKWYEKVTQICNNVKLTSKFLFIWMIAYFKSAFNSLISILGGKPCPNYFGVILTHCYYLYCKIMSKLVPVESKCCDSDLMYTFNTLLFKESASCSLHILWDFDDGP